MSEFDLTEDIEPDEQPDQEEYESREREATSRDTGTVYDAEGEPEVTPHDLRLEDDDEDEE